jgi:hypothetical protein
MIIMDFSQVILGSIMVNLKNEAKSDNPDGRNMIKHLFFSSLLSFKKKFKDKEMIIACDDRHYWRRDFFPHYKGHRKEGRDKSVHDWDFIFEVIEELKQDIRDNFPYKLIQVPGAEADDVIAVLCKYLQTNDLEKVGLFDDEPKPITIISADGDFVQLQKYKNVKQYSSMQKKMVVPKMSLQDFMIEHIVRGDAGDAIPNILSPDNAIVDHIRQTPIKQKLLDNFKISVIAGDIEGDMKRNYIRNKTLIDFDCIPDDIYNSVVKEYESYELKGNRTKILNYMMRNKMKHMMENLSDF